jgi:hypothetical protein
MLRAEFLCASRPSVKSGDKLAETYATIASSLEGAVSSYDAMGLSPYNFAPLTPVVRCGQ